MNLYEAFNDLTVDHPHVFHVSLVKNVNKIYTTIIDI